MKRARAVAGSGFVAALTLAVLLGLFAMHGLGAHGVGAAGHGPTASELHHGLPLELSTPIFAGGLIAALATRWHRRRSPGGDIEKLKQTGLLFSAGLIAGEALIGVLIAIPIVVTKDANVLAVAENLQPGKWAGLAVLVLVGWWMHRFATKK